MLSEISFDTAVPSLLGPEKVSDPENAEIEYSWLCYRTSTQLIVPQYLVRSRTHWKPQKNMDS